MHIPLLVTMLLIAATPVLAADRDPNLFEKAYTALANDTGRHQLCEKISPNACTKALFNSSGTQIYAEQSNCYLHVATATGNPALCQHVRPRSAFLHDGDHFSPDTCHRMIAEGRRYTGSVSFDRALILRHLGYSADDLPLPEPEEPDEIRWLKLYFTLLKSPDFVKSLTALPKFE